MTRSRFHLKSLLEETEENQPQNNQDINVVAGIQTGRLLNTRLALYRNSLFGDAPAGGCMQYLPITRCRDSVLTSSSATEGEARSTSSADE